MNPQTPVWAGAQTGSQDMLQYLHQLMTLRAIERMNDRVEITAMTEIGPVGTGQYRHTFTSADFSAFAKFLADNDIKLDLTANASLEKLRQTMQNKGKRSAGNVVNLPPARLAAHG